MRNLIGFTLPVKNRFELKHLLKGRNFARRGRAAWRQMLLQYFTRPCKRFQDLLDLVAADLAGLPALQTRFN